MVPRQIIGQIIILRVNVIRLEDKTKFQLQMKGAHAMCIQTIHLGATLLHRIQKRLIINPKRHNTASPLMRVVRYSTNDNIRFKLINQLSGC